MSVDVASESTIDVVFTGLRTRSTFTATWNGARLTVAIDEEQA
ncbi:MAG: hypothetical protein ACE5GC_02005 [Acidimicrobiia bacterium]